MGKKDWIRLTENAWYSKKDNLRLSWYVCFVCS